ncbi:MAG: helix-turn-helix transcriptional regulator [Muricauda sp.]|nr:helix-turn-helix transcriptional regulator [Allomuricauda sp.]MBA4746003.1 helix-turn-helix transcriptional regulator [Allomuricauda sp.]|tara:strand:- start:42319 stop:42582 length:264 start_codon:yes stop_codon:yes gene_type:complete
MIDSLSIGEVKKTLGSLCRQQRQRYEMSQTELGEALGISRYTIQNFENGKNATLDTFLKIAKHFDLMDDFYRALHGIADTNNPESMY